MAKRSFYIRDTELDNFQVLVIKQNLKPLIVQGCAGSGKSILALWKAKQIHDAKLGSYYFIVFTKALKKYMRDGIVQLGLNPDRIFHFNAWEKEGYPSADYLIVDEVQDFDLQTILRFQNSAGKACLFFGDSAQQIYKFKNPPPISMEDIAYHTKIKAEQLVFNHRLPKKIARFAQVLNTQDTLEIRCTTEGNELPKVVQINGMNAQLDKIMEIIQTRGLEDVGILFSHNKFVEQAYKYLTGKNHRVEGKWDINMGSNNLDLDFDSNNPKLLTYHSAKGLQFEAVFLPECVTDSVDFKSALYVAITRSYQACYIFHSGNLSPFFNSCPKTTYETQLATSTKYKL